MTLNHQGAAGEALSVWLPHFVVNANSRRQGAEKRQVTFTRKPHVKELLSSCQINSRRRHKILSIARLKGACVETTQCPTKPTAENDA